MVILHKHTINFRTSKQKKKKSSYISGVLLEAYFPRSPTFEHHLHQHVSQERVVYKVPEPVEVGEEEVNDARVGFQHEANSGPELRYGQRLCV